MPPSEQDLVDAKLEAAEARSDTKIGRLVAKIDELARYSSESRILILGSFAGGFLALAALIVAMATYGDAIFSRGMSVRDVVEVLRKEQQEKRQGDTERLLDATRQELESARELMEQIKKSQNPK